MPIVFNKQAEKIWIVNSGFECQNIPKEHHQAIRTSQHNHIRQYSQEAGAIPDRDVEPTLHPVASSTT